LGHQRIAHNDIKWDQKEQRTQSQTDIYKSGLNGV